VEFRVEKSDAVEFLVRRLQTQLSNRLDDGRADSCSRRRRAMLLLIASQVPARLHLRFVDQIDRS